MRQLFMLLLVFTFILPFEAAWAASQPKGSSMIELHTTKGLIVVELDFEKAPLTSVNIKQYVEDGFYDGTIFHRVIPAFMIQGGGLTADMKEKPTRAPVKNESNNGLSNDKYTISMARTNDPHSATAQFFINTKDNGFLNYKAGSSTWGYAVFGKVVEGMDVVDAIEKVPTQFMGYHENVPVEPVVIEKAVVRK